MATDTYQTRRLIGQVALESYINKLPSQEHLRKISADTQWVNAAWIPGRNVAAGMTETVFEHSSLNSEFFVWGRELPLFPPLLALILILTLCGIAAAAQKYMARQQARYPFLRHHPRHSYLSQDLPSAFNPTCH